MVRFWEEGQLASPGVKRMAEDGTTFILRDEVASQVVAGQAGSVLSWQHWFCPDQTTNARCGPTTVEFDIDVAHPLVTLATMLGPSPDWFVGVSGLSLRDQDENWIPQVVVDLRPYDAGTRSANRWELFGPLEAPPLPIHLITTEGGQLVGPDSLGTMTFTLLNPTPHAVPLPTAGWAGLALLGGMGVAKIRNRWSIRA